MAPARTFPSGRRSARQTWRPLAATLAGAAALVAAYALVIGPRLPEPVFHPSRFDGTILWVGPRKGPFYVHGDPERADVVFVGDSRTYDDLDYETLAWAGLGRVARIWGPSAVLQDILPAIAEQRPERVVVGLSPSTLGAAITPIITEVMRRPPPELDRLSLANGIARWAEEERAWLIEQGYAPDYVDVFLARWKRRLRETELRRGWSSREIDRVLGEAVNYFRATRLRTITTQSWRRSWFVPIDPERLEDATRAMLETWTPEERDANEAAVEAALRELLATGADVVAVRFPVAPGVLEVEREFVPDERLRALCRRVAIPYVEDQDYGGTFRDGSHLTWRSSVEYTRDLAERLRDLWSADGGG